MNPGLAEIFFLKKLPFVLIRTRSFVEGVGVSVFLIDRASGKTCCRVFNFST